MSVKTRKQLTEADLFSTQASRGDAAHCASRLLLCMPVPFVNTGSEYCEVVNQCEVMPSRGVVVLVGSIKVEYLMYIYF